MYDQLLTISSYEADSFLHDDPFVVVLAKQFFPVVFPQYPSFTLQYLAAPCVGIAAAVRDPGYLYHNDISRLLIHGIANRAKLKIGSPQMPKVAVFVESLMTTGATKEQIKAFDGYGKNFLIFPTIFR